MNHAIASLSPARPASRLNILGQRARLVASLLLGAVALVGATLTVADLGTRALLAINGLVILGTAAGRPGPGAWWRLQLAPIDLRADNAAAQQTDDARGWSYGEVRRRLFAELANQTRGLLALISLLAIVQVVLGKLWFAPSGFTLLAVELTLWIGIVLGLHLAMRAWWALYHERHLVI